MFEECLGRKLGTRFSKDASDLVGLGVSEDPSNYLI
jgi:hypothetical protein